MCTVKNNLETIDFPLTLKQNKILKNREIQRKLIFSRIERVKFNDNSVNNPSQRDWWHSLKYCTLVWLVCHRSLFETVD